MKTTVSIIVCGMLVFSSCSKKGKDFDASGSFEADETIVSAEATGVIKEFKLEEGEVLKQGSIIGYIDTIQMYLKKEQLKAQIHAMMGKKPDVAIQLAALRSQLSKAEREKERIENLVKGDAATTKQLDDINASITVLKTQIDAQRSNLEIATNGIDNEIKPILVQLEQIQDQINKAQIINPLPGTVLSKYAMQNEMAVTGKALYKIADLSTITLRAYITGNQLPEVKLNQKVKVLTDDGKGGMKETFGIITWISDKAEFTPKTIQTKDERANMVYAIKVDVKNDGTYKIGMYGEVKFN